MNKVDSENGREALQGSEQQVAETARQALEQSVDALPEDITARLATARRDALGKAAEPTVSASWHFNNRYAWGMAASILLVGFIWLFALENQGSNKPAIVADDTSSEDRLITAGPNGTTDTAKSTEDLLIVMELVQLDSESEALLADDLEFLYWLELNEQTMDEDV